MNKLGIVFTLAIMGMIINNTASQPLTELIKVAASDAGAGDQFGYSICVSGDYAILGSPYSDDAGSNSGSAYIFKYDGTIWAEIQKITASDAAASDYFGKSVSISGNYAIVGAEGNDDAGSISGSAYIFEYNGTTWTETQKITASDAAASDYFGKSVSMSGNYAIVGSYGNDIGGANRGSAYIYELSGGIWSETQILTTSDAQNDDYFGYTVFMRGDKAIIGAWADDDGGSKSGSAYIFEMSGSTWTETQKLTASDAAASDYFGWSVAIDGDKAIVGAYLDDDLPFSSGSAYIFELNGGTWIETQKITASDAVANDRFGYSVAISGTMAIVSSHYNDDNGSNSGSAYVFELNGGTWTETQNVVASDAAASDSYGWSVCLSSAGVAAISAPYNDDAGSSSGNVYFFGEVILPVELLSFEATLFNENQVILNWQTASEINNNHFTVEFSKDGLTWMEVTKIDGAGNSSNLLNYNAIDNNPYSGVSYYRLKQTDFDGYYSYSQIKAVNIEENTLFNNVSVFPNPSLSEALVNFDLADLKEVSIKVFDVSGQLIYHKANINTSIHQFEINEGAGVYFIEIISGKVKQQYKLVKM